MDFCFIVFMYPPGLVIGDPLAAINNYYRPDGTSIYLRTGSTDIYIRP